SGCDSGDSDTRKMRSPAETKWVALALRSSVRHRISHVRDDPLRCGHADSALRVMTTAVESLAELREQCAGLRERSIMPRTRTPCVTLNGGAEMRERMVVGLSVRS